MDVKPIFGTEDTQGLSFGRQPDGMLAAVPGKFVNQMQREAR